MYTQYYRSVPGKRPLPGKRPCAEFQGVTVAASIQTYGIYIPGKRPCGPKSRVMFKCPWALTRDTTVYILEMKYKNGLQIINGIVKIFLLGAPDLAIIHADTLKISWRKLQKSQYCHTMPCTPHAYILHLILDCVISPQLR